MTTFFSINNPNHRPPKIGLGDKPSSHLEAIGLSLLEEAGESERIQLVKAACVRLAMAEQGEAAAKAFYMVMDQVCTCSNSGAFPMSTNLSVEGFHYNKRQEKLALLQWLNSFYWDTPLYIVHPSYRHRPTTYSNPLEDFKRAVIVWVAQTWSAKDDELALTAFDFLMDHYVQDHFEKRVRSYTARDVYPPETTRSGAPTIQKCDQDLIEEAIRTALPPKDPETVALWIERTRRMKPAVPKRITELLSIGFVKAGGDVLEGPSWRP